MRYDQKILDEHVEHFRTFTIAEESPQHIDMVGGVGNGRALRFLLLPDGFAVWGASGIGAFVFAPKSTRGVLRESIRWIGLDGSVEHAASKWHQRAGAPHYTQWDRKAALLSLVEYAGEWIDRDDTAHRLHDALDAAYDGDEDEFYHALGAAGVGDYGDMGRVIRTDVLKNIAAARACAKLLEGS